MKNQLTALDIHYLIKEFKELANSKVDKIYHPARKELLIQLYITNKGKKILRIMAPNLIFLTARKGEAEKPSGFCMFLRKSLEGSRLKEIKQINSERVVELVFQKKEKYSLIIELFSKGNIVFCDNNKKIIALVEKQKWKDRNVDVGEKYIYPKKEYNFLKLKESEFASFLKKSNKESIVKALAAELGFGGEYAEELCLLAGIKKNKKLKELEKKEIKGLFDNIKKLINKKTGNLSAEIEPSIEKPLKSKTMIKTENIIKKQQERIKAVKNEIKEENKKAEMIYQKYKLVDEILKEMKKAREKHSWKEIERRLKGHKIIKKVISKESKIIVEI